MIKGIWKDEHIEGWKKVTESIHSHGALAGIQIGHAGTLIIIIKKKKKKNNQLRIKKEEQSINN